MKSLRFKDDHTFKILQFTDIHYQDGSAKDQQTVALMAQIIEEEKPNLIIITGDTVYGEKNLEHLPQALAPIISSKVPWSLVFGNHDAEQGRQCTELFTEILKQPMCMAYHSQKPQSGTGNHIIQILGHDGKLKWAVVALDSGDYNHLKQVGGYDYIKRDQIDWYQQVMKSMEKENPSFRAITFFHIPLREHQDVWDYEVCYGSKNEGVCAARINSGMFAAMQESGHTRAVFVGHDHINDYYGEMQGIILGYGRATGYNTYGKDGFLHGARVIILHEEEQYDLETYLCLENKQRIKQEEKHMPEKEREE